MRVMRMRLAAPRFDKSWIVVAGSLAMILSGIPSKSALLPPGNGSSNVRSDEIYAPFDTLCTDLEDYLWPTDASTVITSSFADYRRTHFHEGIDISTNNRKGYPVYASRSGYISHIHVSRRGYGKMLYVRHPDGFVTAYAHLQKFKDTVETFVGQLQKHNKAYPLEVDVDSTWFRVAKGEVIAYSGDTGTGGAHLHFELRDSSMNAINPFLVPQFPSLLKDQVRPYFHRIAFTPLDRSSLVHRRSKVWIVDTKRSRAGEFYLEGRVFLRGSIGISAQVTDRSDIMKYRTGPYRFKVYLDGDQVFASAKKFVPGSETHQVASYYDRPSMGRRLGHFEKMYIGSGNRLPFYFRLPEGAGLIATDSLTPGPHELTIHASDLLGNESILRVTLLVANR